MNIVLITQGLNPILYSLLNSEHQVIGIVESLFQNSNGKNKVLVKKQSIFFRLKKWLTNRVDTVSELAQKENIPSFLLNHKNSSDLKLFLEQLKPDLMVVFSMSQLIKEEAFSIPKHGTINLHPSLLPKYRGGNPFIWTAYNQDIEYGVTVHFVDKGADTGDIILSKKLIIKKGEKFAYIYSQLIDNIGVKALLEAMLMLESSSVERIKQPKESPTDYARNVHDAWDLIEWEKWSVKDVWHFLRTAKPYIRVFNSPYWEIVSYEMDKARDSAVGSIDFNGRFGKITCNDGIVYCEEFLPIKEKLKKSLLKF